MSERQAEITLLLQKLRDDSGVEERLLDLLHDDLRAVAVRLMRRERADHTLQPTVLVDEAWMQLAGEHKSEWQNREQFLALAARAMRRLLMNHARDRRAAKRGGGAEPEPLDGVAAYYEEKRVDLLGLNDELKKLAREDANAAKIVELRFFGGLTIDEAAQVMGVSPRTAKRAWTVARGRLEDALGGG